MRNSSLVLQMKDLPVKILLAEGILLQGRRIAEMVPQKLLCAHIEHRNYIFWCRSKWPRGFRIGTAAARLLGLRVRIPQEALISIFCDCCVLSGRGLCVRLVTRPEESYRVWRVWVWSWSLENGRPWPTRGCCVKGKNLVRLSKRRWWWWRYS